MAKVTLTKEQVKRLNALNISTKSDDAARKGIIDLLAQNDVDGMDDEDMDTLLDLAESLILEGGGASADEAAETAESEEADDAEALAQEAEAEAEEESEDEDEEEEGSSEEGDEFDDMDRNALKKYIKENGLEVKVFKSDSDDDIRAKIRAADAAAEEAPEVEEEKPAAKKAPAKKTADKPAKKAEKAEKKPTAKRGVKLDPQNNKEDMDTLKAALTDLFPEDEFKYDAVKSAGVTIKHKGQNSNRALVLIENCSLQADGSIKCNLYFLTLAKNLEVLDNADIAYEKCWSGAPFIKGTTLAEAVEAIGAVKEHLTAQVKKIDKRLGENRAKMEEGLAKKSAAKTAPEKKPAAKKVTKK